MRPLFQLSARPHRYLRPLRSTKLETITANDAEFSTVTHVGFAARYEAMALPRRENALDTLGLCPWFGLGPASIAECLSTRLGQRPHQGRSPRLHQVTYGETQPSPHIGRQSRYEKLVKDETASAVTSHDGL